MKISVIYSGGLYKLTGKSLEDIELNKQIDILALINILAEKYGEEIKTALIDNKNGKYKIPVFVNSKKQSYNYVIEENDRVAFMFVVTGG